MEQEICIAREIKTSKSAAEIFEIFKDRSYCVLPTRNGRSGHAFTARGVVRLRNRRHRDDSRPIDPACGCPACRGFSRGYIRHLFAAREIAAAVLVSLHNVAFYQSLVRGCRQAILEGRLPAFKSAFLEAYSQPEDDETR